MITESITTIKFFYNLFHTPKPQDPVIYIGDFVTFYDDETGQYGQGVFEGLYCNLHPQGETSPYWGEHMQGIHRVRVREMMPDGNYRANYILSENVYALGESHAYPN